MKTNHSFTKLFAAVITVFLLTALCPAHAADGVIEGPVVIRNGNDVVIRTLERGDVTVTINDSTFIEKNQGVLFFVTDPTSKEALFPGLNIKVEGITEGNRTIAKTIRYSINDVKRAIEIQAAMAVPMQEAAALRAKVQVQEQTIAALQKQVDTQQAKTEQRFGDLADYDIKQELAIQFDVNSTRLSDQAKKDLEALAAQAKKFKGYLIQVAGYTDADGTASANQALSDRRAGSVVNYLRQSCDVALSRVLAAVAMGEYKAVASNESPQGRAENRRVTVKLGVNRGISP